ncbi:MAG TPA: type II toxin-antitoxin system RelE/ParE family toxin [Pseudonocardiaceae bacterium]|nr:type II toxin-antitoxin system RelE/ParE family toxin [Pseudonocardiaceae bacterium]
MSWEVRLHPEVESWYPGLCTTDPATADLIEDAIDQLAREGPTAGRPLVDRVHGSRHHTMKELRPPPTGTSEVRMLFAFDPARQAIFLIAGDKAGNWQRWYTQAIRLADERFTEHLIWRLVAHGPVIARSWGALGSPYLRAWSPPTVAVVLKKCCANWRWVATSSSTAWR